MGWKRFCEGNSKGRGLYRKMEDAVKILRAAVSRFPECSPAYDALSKVLQVLNRIDEAREVLSAMPSPPDTE